MSTKSFRDFSLSSVKCRCRASDQTTSPSDHRVSDFSPTTHSLERKLSVTYLLTPWNRVLLEKLTYFLLVKKFPVFYGNRRFITAFTRAATCHFPEPDQSSPHPHPTSRRSILILSSHLRLGLPSDLFPLGFTTKILYAIFLSPCVLHALPISFLSI